MFGFSYIVIESECLVIFGIISYIKYSMGTFLSRTKDSLYTMHSYLVLDSIYSLIHSIHLRQVSSPYFL